MKGFVVGLVVLAVGCSSPGADEPVSVVCRQPPAAEVEIVSDLDMTLQPNPAGPRVEAALAVSSAGLPDDSSVGIDAGWQCWDGSAWVTTHVMYRGFGDHAGQTIPVNSDFQIRVPSIGLALDQPYPVVIPDVAPGVYRIADEVLVDGAAVAGLVVVEVTA